MGEDMKMPYVKLDRLLKLAMMMFVLIPGFVQAAGTTSAIRGNIVDGNGNSVAEASVVVQDLRTSVERTYSSNASGTFYAGNLPVGGPYKVTVNGNRSITVPSIALGDIYNLTVNMQSSKMEEVIAYGSVSDVGDSTSGPSANFSRYDLENAVAFDRDITEVYTFDPRISLDQDGQSINCGGKSNRFNSVTLDGISQNDVFGLNANGYSAATGMPFPFDAIEQVSVELAPFDVTFGGFSACSINSVTKQGSNEWEATFFYEYTDNDFRGESIDGEADVTTPKYDETKWGLSVGGPIIQDTLFFFGSYEKSDEPRFIGQGFNGSGVGTERDWLSKADFDLVTNIAQNTYNYDPGGAPSDGIQENEKYMLRFDWNINEQHSLAVIYAYFDGFQDRASDGDSGEFEFSNHFYVKGTETETTTAILSSQWTDAFSTEVFLSNNTIDDSQVTRGPGDFADFQISVNGRDNVIYLGADDSRQANSLNTETDFFKLVGSYLIGDHVLTAGYERQERAIFNQFVQHARGGEYDFFDDSSNNDPGCAALSAQDRANDTLGLGCRTSGIDKFQLGTPSRIYYGSGGGTNVAADAGASFTNTLHSLYLQDEWYLADHDLTVTYGLRYETFESSDTPKFNQAFTTGNAGLRNDANIDDLDMLMPRIGFEWEARDNLSVRGGLGLYSGGNPLVWISNSYSNDGITNVQLRLNNFQGDSVLNGEIPFTPGGPGRGVPQTLFDQVAATTVDNGNTRGVVLLDPSYDQPSEWKFALGATYDLPWGNVQMDVDWLHSETKDAAIYVDLSQAIVGTTILGQPIYDFVNGEDNLMLTNANDTSKSDVLSISFQKDFDFGLDVFVGYAFSDTEDVSPMTSSVAGSNFDNLATLDINDPGSANSNYANPHRFTFKLIYAKEFFAGLRTRFSLFGTAVEGQPQSFVMSGSDLEGDGFFGRHLLYVPSDANDPNVVFEPGFDQAGFFAFVGDNDLGRGGFVERNETNAKWSYRMDFRFDQELPTFIDDIKGKVFFKVFNLSNLINDDWGKANDNQFFSQQVVNASIDNSGRYVFERFNLRDVTDLNENRSLWEARVGIEFSF
jgi:hypothetical protein